MGQCPVCNEGMLTEQLIETWMRKDGQWILIKQIPATRCDICGETTFTQRVSERLATILAPSSPYSQTSTGYYAEYDYPNAVHAGLIEVPAVLGEQSTAVAGTVVTGTASPSLQVGTTAVRLAQVA